LDGAAREPAVTASHIFRYVVARDLGSGDTIELTAGDGRHLTRVVRRARGDPVEVIDAAVRIWPGVVDDAGPPVRVRVAEGPRPGPPALPVHLFVGLLEWGRLDLVVEKGTELGVGRIVVFTSERGRRRGDQESFDRRADRLDRLAEAAARQCGRGAGAQVQGLVPFSAMVDELDPDRTFLLDGRGGIGLGEALRARAATPVGIVVGPDAGFSDAEIAQARGRGVAICRVGAATLRAETAALAATAVAADALGLLGAAP
jgi:16S rRNA (uracil1498-N3)-methyltransferase